MSSVDRQSILRSIYGRTGEKCPVLQPLKDKRAGGNAFRKVLIYAALRKQGKLDDLGLEIDLYTKNPSNSGSSPFSI